MSTQDECICGNSLDPEEETHCTDQECVNGWFVCLACNVECEGMMADLELGNKQGYCYECKYAQCSVCADGLPRKKCVRNEDVWVCVECLGPHVDFINFILGSSSQTEFTGKELVQAVRTIVSRYNHTEDFEVVSSDQEDTEDE